MSVQEVAELQGFSVDSPVFPESVPTAERYRLLGNAVCVHLSRLVGVECARILREEWRAAA